MFSWVIVAVGLAATSCAAQSYSASDSMSISLAAKPPLNLSGVAASVIAIESDQTTLTFECPPSLITEVCSPDLDHHIILGPPALDELDKNEAAIYSGGWVTWHENRWCRLDSKVICTEDVTSGPTGVQYPTLPSATQAENLELRGAATSSSADAELETTSGTSSSASSKASAKSPSPTSSTSESSQSRMSILLATGSPVIPTLETTTSGSSTDAGLLREGQSLAFAVAIAGTVGAALLC